MTDLKEKREEDTMYFIKHISTTFKSTLKGLSTKGGMLMEKTMDDMLQKSNMKGGMIMKTTQTRWSHQIQHTMKLGVLALTVAIVFGITYVTPAVYAVSHPQITGAHNGMAYLAEKEVKREQQLRAARAELKTAQNRAVSGTDDSTCLRDAEKTDKGK
jgi:hypothetical protein